MLCQLATTTTTLALSCTLPPSHLCCPTPIISQQGPRSTASNTPGHLPLAPCHTLLASRHRDHHPHAVSHPTTPPIMLSHTPSPLCCVHAHACRPWCPHACACLLACSPLPTCLIACACALTHPLSHPVHPSMSPCTHTHPFPHPVHASAATRSHPCTPSPTLTHPYSHSAIPQLHKRASTHAHADHGVCVHMCAHSHMAAFSLPPRCHCLCAHSRYG